MEKSSAPPFVDALRSFEQFLEAQGWPTRIRWIVEKDLVRSPGRPVNVMDGNDEARRADAQRCYEVGRGRCLGVLMDAVCTLGDVTCAVISYPTDDREAELLMFPSDGGLKMSVAVPRQR